MLISFTKGVGIREVILTNGCPGGESKCIVRVEECHGPVDCGCELDSVGGETEGERVYSGEIALISGCCEELLYWKEIVIKLKIPFL